MKHTKKNAVKVSSKRGETLLLARSGVPTKTRKAFKRRPSARKESQDVKYADPQIITSAEREKKILDMRLEGYSEHDIGQVFGITQGRVSAILKASLKASTEARLEMGDELLTMELARVDQLILAWHAKARHDQRSAEVLYKWVDRRHKLLGLDVTKQEISGRGGGPISLMASSIDITKLSDEQVDQLAEIMRIAGPQVNLLPSELPK